jgi:hypothetical protein
VNITSPTNGQIVNGTVTVSGTSSDDDDNLVVVEISIDEGTWQAATMLAPDWSLWSYQWDTKGHSNGDHIIIVRAIDDCFESVTSSIAVQVENVESDTDSSQESDANLIYLWVLFPTIAAIAILALIWHIRRRKKEDEIGVTEEPREEVEISSDERIQRLRKNYENGVIPREVYELNLARLGIEDPESASSSSAEEELSYICPLCDKEVEVDATECSDCGAIFED